MEKAPLSRKAQPSLPKWPFVLGDILLISLAVLVISIAGDDLNSWQIGFCVFGVVVGALLLVAPFVIEFYLKQKLHESAEAETIETIINRINTAVGEIAELSQNRNEWMRKLEHTLAAYEGLAGILNKKLKALNEADLSQKNEFDNNRWVQVEEAVQKIATDHINFREQLISEMRTHLGEEAERVLKESIIPEIRERLDSMQPDPAGVAKVVQSKQWETGKAQANEKTEGGPQKGSNDPPERKAQNLNVESGREEVEENSPQGEGSGMEPVSGNGGEISKESATLRPNILIGIGNKIYVRGEGGCLSWEEGIPLEFVEIGLFEWVSPPLSEPVQAQLYLNDEICALGDTIELHPGEVIEVTPDFPA